MKDPSRLRGHSTYFDSNVVLPVPFPVCEYYAHVDCQDFVVSDCMECATYLPTMEKVSEYIYRVTTWNSYT